MKRQRFSVEQIVAAVKQHDLAVSATDLARKLSIAEPTFYRWKKQYRGLESDLNSGESHRAGLYTNRTQQTEPFLRRGRV